ncbi:MAG: sodium:proton exchanger [Marinobacter sp. 34-60-7]|nr:MAG: sodium:proton exchanger [Marinobacter sp. 34-60-7]HET8849732.1 cation:proton antiporter [Marinobacter sp.]
MAENALTQLLLLLSVTVAMVLVFQRLRVPSSLAYLAVGVVLGANTAGPVISEEYVRLIAEYGIVFLLFTIGLSFSLSQIYALRHTILGLGTAQVVLTTLMVGVGAWFMGLTPAAAFVVGAVFAQSSSTIIIRQLSDQNETQSRHGRLGITMSVFQDVTAVPFIVIIPVLGVAAAQQIAGELGYALIKAGVALAAVLLFGRYLLKPLFHLVAEKRSAELFTLTVLFVSLMAAWTTQALGLSMAFGAFLAGMVLADTEFRHQVESTIRPFRDVLVGLFFVSIGMLFDPEVLSSIWLESLAGALVLISVKVAIVTAITRFSGVDTPTAFRTGILLSVGGEFGFALLSIGIASDTIGGIEAQTVLMSVLISMIISPLLIHHSDDLVRLIQPRQRSDSSGADGQEALADTHRDGHVIVCGYGRTGQIVGAFLEQEGFDFVGLELDPGIVQEARLAGHTVFCADAADRGVLENAGIDNASMLIITHNDQSAALQTLRITRLLRPDLSVIVRTSDDHYADELREAGATEVIPETLETGLLIASHLLLALRVPGRKVARHLIEQRKKRYPMLKEIFRSDLDSLLDTSQDTERLHSIQIFQGDPAIGYSIADVLGDNSGLMVSALVREGKRHRSPPPDTHLQADDVLVVLGLVQDVDALHLRMTGLEPPRSG